MGSLVCSIYCFLLVVLEWMVLCMCIVCFVRFCILNLFDLVFLEMLLFMILIVIVFGV